MEESMNIQFIERLKSILEDNLEDDKFGVRKLAREIGLSRSQLHRKLQKITNVSASQYIREYRLKRSMEMLLEEVATAAEIGYRVGFNSPSYFSSSFHKYYGYPPGEAKLRANKLTGIIELNGSSDLKKHTMAVSNVEIVKMYLKDNLVFASSYSVFLILLILFLSNQSNWNNFNFNNGNGGNPKFTIEVLPLLDVSINSDELVLIESIRNAIIKKISSEKRLFILSDRLLGFPNLNEQQELERSYQSNGINYFVAFNTLLDKSDYFVSIQLLDKEGQEIWKLKFKEGDTPRNKLGQTISSLVWQQIEISIENNERAVNTVNLNDLQTPDEIWMKLKNQSDKSREAKLNSSIKEFEESIKNNPNDAQAFLNLAEMYLQLFDDEFQERDSLLYQNVKTYTLKAIALDSSLARGHEILGKLYLTYEWNWELAEKEMKHALNLNPYSVDGNMLYGRYLMHVKRQFDAAYNQFTKVQMIKYNSYWAIVAKSYINAHNGNHDKALKEIEHAKKIDNKRSGAYWGKFNYDLKRRRNKEAFEELRQVLLLDSRNTAIVNQLESVYNTSGMTGIFNWCISDTTKMSIRFKPFYKAQQYAFLGKNDEALALLEIALRNRSPQFLGIRDNFYFEELHANPKFIALLEKIGFETPNE